MNSKRIAMWSGPRNISTAMMYSFNSRPDTHCSDEPLYAHYLAKTGIAHPGASEVISNGQTDWNTIVNSLSQDSPDNSRIWYQKHMCHHILNDMNLDWISSLTNCFLIRNPSEVLISLSKKTDAIDAWATGLPQQALIVEHVRDLGQIPIIVDSRDILLDPRGMLSQLCLQLDIEFDNSMLLWDIGPKECDGIWAKHWYDAVWASKEFAKYQPSVEVLKPEYEPILKEVRPIYEQLYAQRLRNQA